MQQPKLKFVIFNFFLLCILFCFNSCSLKAEQKSLTAQFDAVDAFISQGQIKDALKLLGKTEKRAYDSWSYIGIYKRYNRLGENNLSEKLLKKALKKNSSNLELNAVYANFLLHQDRVNDAEKYAEKLRGTRYGSLYSEVALKKTLDASFGSEEEKLSFFKQEDFYNVYYEAYQGSKNPVWIRNCAVFNLAKGLYSNAAALNPGNYSDVDDSYFWAITLYDAGRYYDSIAASNRSIQYLNDYAIYQPKKTSYVKIYAIQSDSYMAVSDMESAEQARAAVRLSLDSKPSSEDAAILPILYVNSAIFANNQENKDLCADLLFYTVTSWPDYVPGLILYADFAFESNQEREEDAEMKALRRAGITTLEMDKYDNRRKIPLSDALYRIDECIAKNNDPYLYIQKLDLKYKSDKTISEKDKIRDMWNLLEDTYSEDEKYKTLLTQYAICYLLNTKQDEDAFKLYQNYIYEHLTIDPKRDFWEEVVSKVQTTDIAITEISAMFALKQNRLNEALRLYEYIVYESSGILDEGELSIYATTAAGINLADLYFAYGTRGKAISLYGKIAGRESRNRIRSDIYYRLAKIYVADGDIKNALRSADYAKSIYPENAKASLLKDQLTIQ